MPDINNANKHLKTIMDYNKRIIGGDCTRGNWKESDVYLPNTK